MAPFTDAAATQNADIHRRFLKNKNDHPYVMVEDAYPE